ncbi:hypothetical protein FPE01S_02_08650 [Flavihumibacter petaseus NBRC 106054]|uniref:Uncharacterized protein n=1 Tax=Flavihumibacter petaseus NBRC 106054 TaxID=1220578 RepID=A0A0E9N1M8_9BACT|nr:hypothetical protein FPE01S_02_08650 [Flavihumibacter petaseus NBRC 106054]
MTSSQIKLVDQLLAKDRFMILSRNHRGAVAYKIFQGRMNPVGYARTKTATAIWHLMKEDKKGRVTLNRTAIRQVHGNSTVKKLYKNQLHAKGDSQL